MGPDAGNRNRADRTYPPLQCTPLSEENRQETESLHTLAQMSMPGATVWVHTVGDPLQLNAPAMLQHSAWCAAAGVLPG
jgi:hypothetical protein